MARMASQSGQLPTRFGVRIALVRGPIMASMPSTSICSVSGSTSTNAGTMPLRTSGAMSLEKVTGDVITSSPGSQPSRSTASHNADVPLFTITACCLASSSAPRRSNSATSGPIASRPGLSRTRDDRVDLALVVHGAGFGDGRVVAGLAHACRAYRAGQVIEQSLAQVLGIVEPAHRRADRPGPAECVPGRRAIGSTRPAPTRTSARYAGGSVRRRSSSRRQRDRRPRGRNGAPQVVVQVGTSVRAPASRSSSATPTSLGGRHPLVAGDERAAPGRASRARVGRGDGEHDRGRAGVRRTADARRGRERARRLGNRDVAALRQQVVDGAQRERARWCWSGWPRRR